MESRMKFIGLLVPAALLLQGLPAQRKAKAIRADNSKILVEMRIKKVISRPVYIKRPQEKAKVDFAKGTVEIPIKKLINKKGSDDPLVKYNQSLQVNPAALAPGAAEFEFGRAFTKKVAPGKVVWHANYKQALAAAKKSGKPVLHFQLMGKLDDEFC